MVCEMECQPTGDGSPLHIRINGEACTTSEGQTVLGLLSELGIDPSRVAVELNRRILRRDDWEWTLLSDGARLEIVQFVGGG